MKKRLFIAIQYLEIGGAERSLIGLLNAIDYTRYEVDLFLYDHRGEDSPWSRPHNGCPPRGRY